MKQNNKKLLFVKYILVVAKQGILISITSRSKYFLSVGCELLFVYLAIQLWSNISSQGASYNKQLITYIALARIIAPLSMEFIQSIQQQILTGEISNQLIKPISLDVYLMYQEIGRYLTRILIHIFPIYLVIYFSIGIEIPSFTYFILFLISLSLSFIIMFYINFITAIMAFWMTQIFSLNVFKNQTVRFLSGSLVPLWFFPSSIITFIKFLPFASIVFIPIQIYLEIPDKVNSLMYLLLQGFWVLTTVLISKCIWNMIIKRISINGG